MREPQQTQPKEAGYIYIIAYYRLDVKKGGVFMTNFILLALWTTAIYFIVRHIKRRKYHKSDVKFFRIYRGVHDLE